MSRACFILRVVYFIINKEDWAELYEHIPLHLANILMKTLHTCKNNIAFIDTAVCFISYMFLTCDWKTIITNMLINLFFVRTC